MKKNVLALSIATMVGGLGFAGAANAALDVNESGAGHILMVPYYTAQNGNMSVFHITNTDRDNGKAVKVRFRGASNSDDVLDFQVFMSPGDVWTAAVTKDEATGLAKLTTADNSCTYPPIPAEGVNFVTDRLTQASWDDAAKAEQTLEGYVEILTMADIPKAAAANEKNSLYKAIKHDKGVAPCTSEVLQATLAEVTPATSYNLTVNGTANVDPDLIAPSLAPSLTGQWYVMNVEQTTAFSAAMPAIAADTAPLNVFSPQKNGPAALETADPLMAVGAIEAQFYDVPDLSTPYEAGAATAADQAIALTGAIARTAVINQYASDAGIDAKTDWVFSMPTRRYSIAANYDAKTATGASTLTGITAADAGTTVTTGGVTLDPASFGYRVVNELVTGNEFTAVGTGALALVNGGKTSVNNAGQICLTASATKFWDREEVTSVAAGDQPVFSPGTPSKPATFDLCGEVSVLAFSADESALGAKLSRQNVAAKYVNGWGEVTFGGNVPVLGSAFVKLSNPAAREGVSGNFGLTWAHAYK